MYRHPRKTPNTPHYDWLERKNEEYNVEDYKFAVSLLNHWYRKAKVYEEILKEVPMEDFARSFKKTFPESTVYFNKEEVK